MDKPKYNEGMAVTYRLAQCGVGIDYVWEDNIIV